MTTDSAMPNRADWLAGGSRHQLTGSQYSLFVRQDGPEGGLPVTVLHGFPSSSHDWAGVLPYLVAAGMRVTSLDFLGFGDSDKPHPHDYSILEQAGFVEQVWDALGIDSTALVAHDLGVSIAQELISRGPDRITSMTWLNGGVFADLHRPTRGQRLLRGPLGPLVARSISEKRLTASIRDILGRPVDDSVMHDLWLSVDARRGTRVLQALLRYMDERRTHMERWSDAMRSYAGSQHFIWGPVDPVSGAHVLPRIREVVPGATVTVLDGVGHYPQVEATEVVGPLIVASIVPSGPAS